MKRDLDLIRRILLAVELSDDDPRELVDLDVGDEHSLTVVAEHVRLLHEAGLIEAANEETFGPDGYRWVPKRLTWAGHDFLDAARDLSIWNEAMQRVKSTVGSVGVSLLKELLQGLARQSIGLLD